MVSHLPQKHFEFSRQKIIHCAKKSQQYFLCLLFFEILTLNFRARIGAKLSLPRFVIPSIYYSILNPI